MRMMSHGQGAARDVGVPLARAAWVMIGGHTLRNVADTRAALFEYDVPADRWAWSDRLRSLHGLGPKDEPSTDLMLARMVPEDRPTMTARFEQHLQNPGAYSCAYRLIDPAGRVRQIVLVGESEAAGGVVKRLHGFVVDITDAVRQRTAEAVGAAAEHRAAIEQAKGALMLGFGVDHDAAFDLLRTYSNRSNVKLAALAEHIVARLASPEFSREEPVRSLLDILMDLESPDSAPVAGDTA